MASLKGKAPRIKRDDTARATRIVQRENAFTGERTYAGRIGSRYSAVNCPLPKHEKYPGKEVEAGILWTLLYFSTLEKKTLPQTALSLFRLQIIDSNKIQQCKLIPKSATQLQHSESPNIGTETHAHLDPMSFRQYCAKSSITVFKLTIHVADLFFVYEVSINPCLDNLAKRAKYDLGRNDRTYWEANSHRRIRSPNTPRNHRPVPCLRSDHRGHPPIEMARCTLGTANRNPRCIRQWRRGSGRSCRRTTHNPRRLGNCCSTPRPLRRHYRIPLVRRSK